MISRLELDNTTPVKPPTVNKKIKPKTHNKRGWNNIRVPNKVVIQLKTLIAVGIAITIVADVK